MLLATLNSDFLFAVNLFVLVFYCPVNPMESCRLFVLRFYDQSTQWGHVERGQFPNHTFTGQA